MAAPGAEFPSTATSYASRCKCTTTRSVHTHIYTCTHTYIYTHIHMHTRIYIHTHTHAHTHIYTHTYTCTHTYNAHTSGFLNPLRNVPVVGDEVTRVLFGLVSMMGMVIGVILEKLGC